MYLDTSVVSTQNPAELCAAVGAKNTRDVSTLGSQPNESKTASGKTKVSKVAMAASKTAPKLPLADSTTPDAASVDTQPINVAPHQAPWSSGHITLEPYTPTQETTDIINAIINIHRQRQGMLKAKTKLILQAKASLRFATQTDDDFASDEAKAAARKRNDDLYATVKKDPTHPLHANLLPYDTALAPLEAQADAYAKDMVRLVKKLPIYSWVKDIKGFGDVSFATIIGECGDIGTYKSVSAVWKRLGLAVMDGNRQGNPGTGASAEDWIAHGYNKKRRSVSYVAREHVIGGMGKWRPVFGDDVQANEELTYYQRVYAERARYEAIKLDMPVTESATGKESYKKHVSMRAHRYVEKRLLRNLYIEWRRAA